MMKIHLETAFDANVVESRANKFCEGRRVVDLIPSMCVGETGQTRYMVAVIYLEDEEVVEEPEISDRVVKQTFDVIKEFKDSLPNRKKQIEDAIRGKSVDELELTTRSANCMLNARIKTIGQLVERTEDDLLKIKNFGRKSLNEIKEALAEVGLTLAPSIGS